MPRRMVTSELFRNDKIAELDHTGRLFFIGLITNADDDGRLKGSPKYLKANIFPYDNISIKDILQYRELCCGLGIAISYNVNGTEVIALPGWAEHQIIRSDRYKKSKLPPPPEGLLVNANVTQFNYSPPLFGQETYEKAAQHAIALKLKFNEWQPTQKKIINVETNKRLGNLYADIVALTDDKEYILIEVKAYPLQPNDLGQIIGYRKEMEQRNLVPIVAILIGGGLGKLTQAEANEATVILQDLSPLIVDTTVKSTVDLTDTTPLSPNIIEYNISKDNINNRLLKKYPPHFINLRKDVFTGLKERRDYVSRQPGAEAKAISQMLAEDLSPVQILQGYDLIKKQPFYQDKNLSMMQVRKDIHEVLRGGKSGTHRGYLKETSTKELKESIGKPLD